MQSTDISKPKRQKKASHGVRILTPKASAKLKLIELCPRLANLDWYIEQCRPYSGSALHGEPVTMAQTALNYGNDYLKYSRMLAYPACATRCRSDTLGRIVENWDSAGAKFSLAEHKAVQLYNQLFN